VNKRKILVFILLAAMLIVATGQALAQSSYSFNLANNTTNVFLNEDGTASIDYVFEFKNDPSAGPIEFVDVAMPPGGNFDVNTASADVNGIPVTNISRSDYQGEGKGYAIGLGSHSIPPGKPGTVHTFIGTVRDLFFKDSSDPNFASVEFSPAYFDSSVVHGNTNMSVTFHMPPGVKPNEPRWHQSPPGWQSEPTTGIDEQGRVTYTWSNPAARGDTLYRFGASVPRAALAAGTVQNPSIFQLMNIDPGTVIYFLFCCGFIAFFVAIIAASFRSTQKRKLQYMPPKIAIEGHGIKRGLTAVEASILLEQPLDKVMTMILFGVIKKNAASVITRDPLEINVIDPQPEDLNAYEVKFLEAFKEKKPAERRRLLSDMMIDLVQSVSQKMKGFSRRETIAYYREIINRAWAEVEAAQTPEVKSEKYSENMEWTMMDKNYDDRTREVFRGGPVFVPVWWPHYDPTFGRPAPSGGGIHMPTSTQSSGGGGVSLPNLPGSDFAASIVLGTQNFASSVIGNVTDFTSTITNKTNPVPVPPPSSSGGSHSGGGCACACACAGCACACAGGGR